MSMQLIAWRDGVHNFFKLRYREIHQLLKHLQVLTWFLGVCKALEEVLDDWFVAPFRGVGKQPCDKTVFFTIRICKQICSIIKWIAHQVAWVFFKKIGQKVASGLC